MWDKVSRIATLTVTNVIKLTGLLIGYKAATATDRPDAVTLAFAAFMMAGAQVGENAVLSFAEKFFGVSGKG